MRLQSLFIADMQPRPYAGHLARRLWWQAVDNVHQPSFGARSTGLAIRSPATSFHLKRWRYPADIDVTGVHGIMRMSISFAGEVPILIVSDLAPTLATVNQRKRCNGSN